MDNTYTFRKGLSIYCFCMGMLFVSKTEALTWAFDTYQGNGVSGHLITGLGFQPDVVIIKGTGASASFIRSSTQLANNSKSLDIAGAYASDGILSFSASGFSLGTNAGVNTNGATYDFVAFKSGTDMKVGTYTGNGGFNQTIAGITYTADLVIVFSDAGGEAPVFSQPNMPANRSAFFGNSQLWSNYITTISATGFTVGSFLNTGGQVYHYITFKQVGGTMYSAAYSGSAGTQNVTTIGMTPQYVIACNGDAGPTPVQKMGSNLANESMYFTPTASSTTDITALGPGYFTVNAGSASCNSTFSTNYFSVFGSGIAFPLPVQLIDFKAKCVNGTVGLNWTTGSETNNAFFTVEKISGDGLHTMLVGKVPGAGTTSSVRNYFLTDAMPDEGMVYYRLRQTDLNGRNTYSSFLTFDGCSASGKLNLSVYPNPGDGEISYAFDLKQDQQMLLEVFSPTGSLIESKTIQGTRGSNVYTCDISSYAEGLYLFRLSGGERTVVKKVVVK